MHRVLFDSGYDVFNVSCRGKGKAAGAVPCPYAFIVKDYLCSHAG